MFVNRIRPLRNFDAALRTLLGNKFLSWIVTANGLRFGTLSGSSKSATSSPESDLVSVLVSPRSGSAVAFFRVEFGESAPLLGITVFLGGDDGGTAAASSRTAGGLGGEGSAIAASLESMISSLEGEDGPTFAPSSSTTRGPGGDVNGITSSLRSMLSF